MRMDKTTAQKTIKEGQAEICVGTEKVFYNPVQEFNRDLSIAVLTLFTHDYKTEKQAKKLKINDAAVNENKMECEVCLLHVASLSIQFCYI